MPTVLVSRFSGSRTSSQPPARKIARKIRVGRISTAGCRWVRITQPSLGSRYFLMSLRACADRGAWGCGRVTAGLDERPAEIGERGGRVAEGLPDALHALRRLLRRLDDVEDHECDDQPGEDLLEAHSHLHRCAHVGRLRSAPELRLQGPPGWGGRLRPMGNTAPIRHIDGAPT